MARQPARLPAAGAGDAEAGGGVPNNSSAGDFVADQICGASSQKVLKFTLSWSELPDLVLDNIVMRLRNPVDFSSFRRVCNHWRKVAKSTEALFLRSTLPQLLCEVETGRFQDPTNGAVYGMRGPDGRPPPRMDMASGYSYGYLILVNENRSGRRVQRRFYLRNILTGEERHGHYPVLEHRKGKGDRILWAGLSAAPTSPTSSLVVLYHHYVLIFTPKQPWRIIDVKDICGISLHGAAVIAGDEIMALSCSKKQICLLKLCAATGNEDPLVFELVGIFQETVNIKLVKLTGGRFGAFGRLGPDGDWLVYELDIANMLWRPLSDEQSCERGVAANPNSHPGFELDLNRKLIWANPGDFPRM